MPRALANIAFTASVKNVQQRLGGGEFNRRFELTEDSGHELTARELDFLAARDSFYVATVSDSGWPYVQHRGGPPGFLKALDGRAIGFADFRGNVQYLTVGNLSANDRIALILVNYPLCQRLKIWGRARLVEKKDNPALVAQFAVPSYRALVERAVVISVKAYDWNCTQHITPRFTEPEVQVLVAPLLQKINMLQARLELLQAENR